MKAYYERKIYKLINIFLCLCLSVLFVLGGCQTLPPFKNVEVYQGLSVHFLDVGQGDCIFINLPDGKTVLIDCGLNDSILENSKYIEYYLDGYGVETIDYFILTHPDTDHIGNAEFIMDNFGVSKAFIPTIPQSMTDDFPTFSRVMDKIREKGIDSEISDCSKSIRGDGYFLAFLSPNPKGTTDSSYDNLIENDPPTDLDINNLSPIIYMMANGKKFLFTGDAQKAQENLIINNYNSEIYQNLYHKDLDIDLTNVDYLKVSHHGSSDATGQEFLQFINPKNAIISVGAQNFYGHPNSETLTRIRDLCPDCSIFRTDLSGTISIREFNGQMIIN